jgi:hypothetical protein
MTRDAGRAWNPTVPDSALAEVLNRKRLTPVPTVAPIQTNGMRIYDLVGEQSLNNPKTRRVAGRTVMRDMSTVNTLIVHQTAIPFDVADYQIHAAHGDRRLAKARRALDVAAHGIAYRDGFGALGHDVRAYVNAAGPGNPFSVNLEIEGRYPGLLDDPETTPTREDVESTWGGPPMMLDSATIAAACATAERLCRDVAAFEGCKLRYVMAHRQTSATRRADPGEEIWRKVVLDYIVPVLGLQVRYDTAGTGREIPAAWDPNGVGAY